VAAFGRPRLSLRGGCAAVVLVRRPAGERDGVGCRGGGEGGGRIVRAGGGRIGEAEDRCAGGAAAQRHCIAFVFGEDALLAGEEVDGGLDDDRLGAGFFEFGLAGVVGAFEIGDLAAGCGEVGLEFGAAVGAVEIGERGWLIGRAGRFLLLVLEEEELFDRAGFARAGALGGRGLAGGGGLFFIQFGLDALAVPAPGFFAFLDGAGVIGEDAGDGFGAFRGGGVGLEPGQEFGRSRVGFFEFGEVVGRERGFGVAGELAGELVGFVGAAAGDENGAVGGGAAREEAGAGAFEDLVEGVDEVLCALAEVGAGALEAAAFARAVVEFGFEIVVGELVFGGAFAEGFVAFFGERVDDACLFDGKFAGVDAVEHGLGELEDFEGAGDVVGGLADGAGDAFEGPAGGAELGEGACAFERRCGEEGEVVGEGEGEFAVAAEAVLDLGGGDEDGDLGEAGLDGGAAAAFAEDDAEAVAFGAGEDGLEHAEFLEGGGEIVAGACGAGVACGVAGGEEGFGVDVGEAGLGGELRGRAGVGDAAAAGLALVAADFVLHVGGAGDEGGDLGHLFKIGGMGASGVLLGLHLGSNAGQAGCEWPSTAVRGDCG